MRWNEDGDEGELECFEGIIGIKRVHVCMSASRYTRRYLSENPVIKSSRALAR